MSTGISLNFHLVAVTTLFCTMYIYIVYEMRRSPMEAKAFKSRSQC